MGTEVIPYKAIVWPRKEEKSGVHVEITASSLEEAESLLKKKYGPDIIYSIYNEEVASRPR